MTSKNSWHQPKRLAASAVTAVFLLQTILPAYAAVLQVPGIYLAPPNPNVMYTLDDSGSMTSDAIPDFLDDPATSANDVSGMPTDSSSNALGQSNATFPGMWKNGSGYLHTTYYRSDNDIARYLRSSAGNPLYYDPTVTYKPWPTPSNDQQVYADADPANVNIHDSDPFNTGRRINLNTRVNITGTATSSDDQTRNFWPATYYVYTSATPMPPAKPHNSLNIASNFTKFEIKSTVGFYPRAATRTDCTGAVGATGCSYTVERQNFANWLQFYRSRMLMAKGGVAAAFSQQGTNLRVGFTTINTGATVRRGVSTFSGTNRSGFYSDLYGRPTNGSTPLRESMDHVGKYFLGGTSRGNPWAEVTSNNPTRADSCRKSFHILSTDGFWNGNDASSPANQNNDTFATAERTPSQPDNTVYAYTDSGTPGTLASRFTVSPFRDNNTANQNTLADVAAYYWKTDLQGGVGSSSTIDNRVSPSSRDPAYWQHLTTFTVGLGVNGSGGVRPVDSSLSSVDATSGAQVVSTSTPSTSPFYPYRGQPWLSDAGLRDLLVTQRTPMQWTTATRDVPTTGDDLIHAAMNSRGRYLSATNPTALASGIASALAEATNQTSSYASLGLANPSSTASDNKLFQAVYNPYGWTGRVYAFSLTGGSFSTDPAGALWEASRAMPAPNSRSIFTWNRQAAPVPQGSLFTWAGLNGAQQAALGPAIGVGSSLVERMQVLEYLRGSVANEVQSGGPLRDRVRDRLPSGAVGGVLGDVVGGSPLKGPDYGGGYDKMRVGAPGQATYAAPNGFRTDDLTQSSIGTLRQSLFLAANDGMLHALNSNDGAERFAYVPDSVFSVPRTTYKGSTSPTVPVQKLYELSRPDYAHLFTVDGPPQISDAYIGPTLAGASWKSVLLGTTGAGARSVFAMDVTNPEVGPATTQFNTSKILWEFSEEQNTDMGHIPYYPHVAKMQDGTWVAMFGNGYDSSSGRAKLFLIDLQTGAIVWERAVGPLGGNGLSQPNFMLNRYREVVSIFAGDLRGNMWKFDVNSPNRSNWNVAYGGSPLFTTPANQPITVMPELARFPNSTQAMVMFGTGRLFFSEDTTNDLVANPNMTRQAIYGLWDNESTAIASRAQLVEQTMLPGNLNGYRGTSDNPINWATQRGWYLQLENATGERVNVNPVVPTEGGAVPLFVVANTPSMEPCSSGGSARVFALDPITGQSPRFSVYDADRSGTTNAADGRRNVLSISAGILSSPSFLLGLGAGSPSILTEKIGTRGQTGTREGGVTEESSNTATSCSGTSAGRLIAGVSDTSAINETVKLSECKGRVSWRQIQ